MAKIPSRKELEEELRKLRAIIRGYQSEEIMNVHLISQQAMARAAKAMAKQLYEQLDGITDSPMPEKENK